MAIIKIKNAAGEWEDLVSDSLEDNSPSKALSAKQGKILDESKADKSDTYTKTEVNSLSNGKIDKPTSSTPAGKFMQTDDHGNAIWGDGASGAEVGRVVTAWLEENISGGQTIAIDTSLSVPGAAAESATVGNLLDEIIQVADEEPTDEFNKIWVEETPDSEIEIPDYEDFENLVTVSSDEPTAPANKVWIKPSGLGEVAVTTYEEFTGVVAPDYDTINVSGSMPIKVGQHCIHNGEYYSCKIEITEPETFTLSHWIKMTVGSEASDLKSAFDDIVDRNGLERNYVIGGVGSGGNSAGVVYTCADGYKVTANGLASSNSYYSFFNSMTNLSGLENGKTYRIKFTSDSESVSLQTYYYKSGGSLGTLNTSNNKFTLPANAVGLLIRSLISSGTTVSNAHFSLEVYDDVNLIDEMDYTLGTVDNVLSNIIEKNKLNHNFVIGATGQAKAPKGIEYTLEDGYIVHANGKATDTSYFTFINASNSLCGMEIGEKYTFDFTTTDQNIVIEPFIYKSGGSVAALDVSGNAFTVPSNAVGFLIRAKIASGTTVTNADFSLSIFKVEGIKDEICDRVDTDETVITGIINKNDLRHNIVINGTGQYITENGIKYSLKNGYIVTANGLASANSYFGFLKSENSLCGLKAGKTCACVFTTSSQSAVLQAYYFKPGGDFATLGVINNVINIPDNAVGLWFRVLIASGTTVSNITFSLDVYDNSVEDEQTYLPQYWQQYLENKHQDLFDADMSVGFNGFSFAFITDMHWLFNQKKSPAILRWIKDNTSISTIVQGGDILSNYTYHSLDPDPAYMEFVGMTKDLDMINIFGNHDLDTNNTESEIYTKADYYSICQRTTESFVHWEVGTLCGYYDNPVQKVRMIFWDYSLRTYTLLTSWISELETGWSVIVFTHYIWHLPTDVSPDETYGQPLINAVDSVYDSADCTIIGIVCGHLHADKSTTSVKGYPIIGTTCDASTGGQSDLDPDNPTRTPGTTTEQAFDLYYINKTNKTINTIRIGAGDTSSDRSFTYP